MDRQITIDGPVWDKSARHDGTFSRADFVFDQERNVYICPGGKELTSTGNIDQGHIVYYRANKHDCSTCLLKPKCTTAPMRKVTRDVNEDVRDRVRALATTEAFRQSCRERKKVEMRFAHMKRILKFDRLRLRGLSGAKDEVLLTAIAQNLRRLAKLAAAASCLSGVSLASGIASDATGPSNGGWGRRTIKLQVTPFAKKSRVLQHNPPKADVDNQNVSRR